MAISEDNRPDNVSVQRGPRKVTEETQDRITVDQNGSEAPGKAPDVVVSTGVPQILHPLMLQKQFEDALMGGGPETAVARPAYTAVMDTFKKAYDVAAMMHETTESLARHEVTISGKLVSEIPHDIAVQAGTAMGAAFDKVAPLFDNARNEVEVAIKALTGRINAKLVDPKRNEASRAAIAAEIRDYVRHFPTNLRNESGGQMSRFDWVHGRISEGDHEVVSAIFTANSGWAMGFNKKDWTRLRDLAEFSFSPTEYRTREHLSLLHEHVLKGGGWLLDTFQKCYSKVKTSDPRAKQRDAIKRMQEAA